MNEIIVYLKNKSKISGIKNRLFKINHFRLWSFSFILNLAVFIAPVEY